MSPLVSEEQIIDFVSQETGWMVAQRMQKLRAELHDTMSINPFLVPILYDLHFASDFAELGSLLLAGHLMIGHATSFGKLIDEKVLSKVFGVQKLSARYRAANLPLLDSCFNEIDHIVPRPNRKPALLSLKTSRWTINLSGAKELNTQFAFILEHFSQFYNEIVVGVINGKPESLGDKYDILRGINRGKFHNVIDLQSNVKVLSGRDFWSWLNAGEPATQDWILDGITRGLQEANCREESRVLLTKYTSAFNRRYAHHLNDDGTVKWHQLLKEING